MKRLQEMIQRYRAERARQARISRELETLTDPHLLTLADFVSRYERKNPGVHVNSRGIQHLRSKLEAR